MSVRIGRWVRLIVSCILIALLLVHLDRPRLWHEIRHIDFWVFFAMVVVNGFVMVLFAIRWRIIANRLCIDAPFMKYLGTIWASQFAGQFGPTLVLAEGTRFWMFRNLAHKDRIALSQIIDRLSGQIVLFLIGIALMPLYFTGIAGAFHIPFNQIWLYLIVASVVIFAVCAHRRWPLKRFYHQLRCHLAPIANRGHYLASLLIQCLLFVNFYWASVAVHANVDPFEFFLLIPLIFISLTLLPISIADWGTREVSALLILQSIAIDPEKIVSMSLLVGFTQLAATLPGAFFLVRSNSNTPIKFGLQLALWRRTK